MSTQSRLESGIETTVNIGSGFLVSLAMWAWVVKPLIERGWLELGDAFAITAIFTVSSVLRSYFWRRFFDRGFHRWVHEHVRKFL